MTIGARNRARSTGGISYRVAWSVCGLTLALTACSVVLAGLNRSDVASAAIFPLALTVSAMVGGLVASRRPANPVGWFFLGSSGCFALVTVATEYATYGWPGAPAMAWLQGWLWLPGAALLLFFMPLYFPDGDLVSTRWRWLARAGLFFSVGGAIYSAFSPWEMRNGEVINPLGIEALGPVSDLLGPFARVLLLVLLFASAASLVVRFRRSGSVERQQIKWLAFAALAIPIWFLTNTPIEAISRTLFAVMDALIVFTLIPVAAGIAILRYRLYDIDVVINRTLVYGALTAILVVVYFGGVATTQLVFRALTGQQQQPQLAIVVSTLVIAALFNPLRRRIQSFIDRRFYRKKYDARKTLEAFSARLREETDLETLNADLVRVVRETMQPSHISLWQRPDTPTRGEHTR